MPSSRTPRFSPKGFVPKAVLFDFDGVLVNSEPLHYQALRATVATDGIDLSEDLYFGELIGFDDRGALRHLYYRLGKELPAPLLLKLLATKSGLMREVIDAGRYAALPGVYELVRALWRHYPLAVCSGALRDEIEAMLDGIGLRDCFPVITAAEDVTIGKPDPQGYLMTMSELARRTGQTITPSDCLIVEDAPTVIRNARAAGFRTLGVATSHRLPDLADADRAVETLSIPQVAKAFPSMKMGV